MDRIIEDNKKIIEFESLDENKDKEIGYLVFYFEFLLSSIFYDLNENEVNELNEIIKMKMKENRDNFRLLLVGVLRYFV